MGLRLAVSEALSLSWFNSRNCSSRPLFFPGDFPAIKRPLNARKIAVSARFPDHLRANLQILFLIASRARCPSVGGVFHCKTATSSRNIPPSPATSRFADTFACAHRSDIFGRGVFEGTEPVEVSVAKSRGEARLSPASPLLLCAGSLFLLLSISVAVSVGAVQIPVSTVWGTVANKVFSGAIDQTWSVGHEAIVWEIRFPRSILACVVGAGLALVGTALQAVTRNPLADPHLMGISSGAAFGAILALLHTGLFLGLATVPLMAFAGALGATFLVLVVSRLTGATSPARLILAGVAVSFVVMAAANILIFVGDPRATHTVVFWMLGGLGLAQWEHLLVPFSALVACGACFWAKSGDLNAITVGDETASTLGIPVSRFRLMVFVAGALLTGVMVAYSGIIGFVGLMIPHIVRMVVGGDNARVIPVAALFGSIFLLWADIAARTVVAPEDLPIGIVSGLVGGLFFIWMLRRRRF